MTTDEVKSLLKECMALYTVYRSIYEDAKVIDEWYKTLANYDKRDIYASLDRHKAGAYSSRPIVLADLIRDIPTIEDKQNNNCENYRVYCKTCGRLIPYRESKMHEDRCRSTEYVINNYKKWFHKELTPKFLWSLEREEFDEKYVQLLHYIHDHTTDERERRVIGYIFNPPSVEETKEFFGTDKEEV